MLGRNLLLALGALFLLAGLGLALMLIGEARKPPLEANQPQPAKPRPDAVLAAAHPLPAGTLLRSGDFRWREIEPGQERQGGILRSEVSETEYLGAIARRDFTAGEALSAADLVKPADRRFLSAVLRPSARAVSIAVDTTQSSSGLVLPGDRVDVILTQNFANAADASHKTVAETVLRNVRVIAVDQRLNLQPKLGPADGGFANETHPPKTVTLELNEAEAERLFVAAQLGGLQLSVRALAGAEQAAPAVQSSQPVWAADVSPALRELSHPSPQVLSSGSTVEAAVRRPPVDAD